MSAYDSKQLMLVTKLDDPMKVFFWDFDQAFIIMLMFVIGIMANMIIYCTLIGFGFAHLWQKLKGSKNAWFLIHGGFWHLPLSSKSVRLGDSSEREFLG
ncbi:type IV conjugative transfer system protein TraL [Hydromonas duriensis]|uniref:Type IV conjugative transfer system protein TraL n=1 Tax=Hydromonas duriensis TaxID=1527608 RepID=A0A4R6Y4Z4_9BURK|nr:type IV conjugative transfer system protein TraL [Hydromonas duriensis]TDR30280.1 type IV conjugative transfer system protein TraL [Hydromonas duriensis]